MHVRDLFDLTGKVAIVTGGSRGLGFQMAEALGEAGASLALTARKTGELDAAAARLRDRGIRALAAACDVARAEEVEASVARTLGEYGRVDILINNAGATWGAPVLEMPLDAWHKVLETNVTGTMLMSRAVGRRMIDTTRLGLEFGHLPLPPGTFIDDGEAEFLEPRRLSIPALFTKPMNPSGSPRSRWKSCAGSWPSLWMNSSHPERSR